MSTIQFAGDAIHQVRSNSSGLNGVVTTRRPSRSRSRSGLSTGNGGRDVDCFDEKGDGNNTSLMEDDVKKKQVSTSLE